MLKKIIFIVGSSLLLQAHQYHYDVKMEFKRGWKPYAYNFTMIVNGEQLDCDCGRGAVYLVFYYGTPIAYCSSCLPIRRPDIEIDFDKMLSKGRGNENGTVEIKQ